MLSKRERQYKKVLKSLLDRGTPEEKAPGIAGAVVNKTRAQFSKDGRGPKLLSEGGSRRQYYPGKAKASIHKDVISLVKTLARCGKPFYVSAAKELEGKKGDALLLELESVQDQMPSSRVTSVLSAKKKINALIAKIEKETDK